MKLQAKHILVGLGIGALVFRSKFNPIVIDPGIAKRYLNRLLINVVAFKFDQRNRSLNIALRIDNPNPNPISIQSIVGQVYFQNQLLGDVAYYSQKEIPALRNTSVILAIMIKNPNIVLYITQYLLQGGQNQKVDFVGNISVNGQVLAVKESFNFK